jgi:hypothetical protein
VAPPPLVQSLVVGRSARMQAVFAFLRVIGNSESTVLITASRTAASSRA